MIYFQNTTQTFETREIKAMITVLICLWKSHWSTKQSNILSLPPMLNLVGQQFCKNYVWDNRFLLIGYKNSKTSVSLHLFDGIFWRKENVTFLNLISVSDMWWINRAKALRSLRNQLDDIICKSWVVITEDDTYKGCEIQICSRVFISKNKIFKINF